MMESQKEDEILLDYDLDSEIDGPIDGYLNSNNLNNHPNYLSDGPVQVVPTARGAARVTSMGLTNPSNDPASDDGLLDLVLPGSRLPRGMQWWLGHCMKEG